MNYKQQDYERDIKILEGAPAGATHVSSWYYKMDGYVIHCWARRSNMWLKVESIKSCDIRSLSDIRSLVSMYEQLQGDTNE